MKKILCLIILALSLPGCSYFHVHHMDIEQGNIITPEMISRVHVGMSMEQVKDVMGSPVLVNVFEPNRRDYVYTYKPGYGDFTAKYITFIFTDGRVSNIKGNLYSQYINH